MVVLDINNLQTTFTFHFTQSYSTNKMDYVVATSQNSHTCLCHKDSPVIGIRREVATCQNSNSITLLPWKGTHHVIAFRTSVEL